MKCSSCNKRMLPEKMERHEAWHQDTDSLKEDRKREEEEGMNTGVRKKRQAATK